MSDFGYAHKPPVKALVAEPAQGQAIDRAVVLAVRPGPNMGGLDNGQFPVAGKALCEIK